MLDRRLPREQAVDAVVVVLVPQLRNRPKPHLMCGACHRFCVGVAVGHDDEAQNADFWRGDVAVQSVRVVPMGAPCPLVRVGVLAHRCGGAETDEIEAMTAGVLDAGRRVSRVPQWRIGLLQRRRITLDLHLSGGEEGGPVVDAAGALLGMSTAGPRGRALVIPASTVNRILPPLIQTGRVARGWLGAALYPVALSDAVSQQIGQDSGLMVLRVAEGGPAAAAGVIAGDILVAIGGTVVGRPSRIAQSFGPESIGQQLELSLLRAGTRLTLNATIATRPSR